MSKWNLLEKLKLFPSGLNSLYERMVKHIDNSDDFKLCKQILASVTLVYRSLMLQELSALIQELEEAAENQE